MGRILRTGAWLAIVLIALVPAEAMAKKKKKVVCGQTITKSIKLPNDLRECPNDGLIVTKDKITVDLNGHTIDAIGSDWDGSNQHAGVRVVGRKSVTVKGGTIKGFAAGVALEQARKAKVSKLSLVSNGAGMSVWESDEIKISALRIQSSWVAGVLVNASRVVLIETSTAWGGVNDGFRVSMGSQQVTLDDNVAFLNQGNGFQIDADSMLTTLDGNRAVHNTNGIKVDGPSAWIGNNEANDNDNLGIWATDEVTDGGGNIAHDNANPEYDCMGIECEETAAASP